MLVSPSASYDVIAADACRDAVEDFACEEAQR